MCFFKIKRRYGFGGRFTSAFDQFFWNYPTNVQVFAKKIRALILETIPEIQEFVDPPSKIVAYGFSEKYADLVCAIAPTKTYVNLMFSKGTQLSDPQKLLTGSGKKARHVKLDEDTLLDNPALKELIQQAMRLTGKK